MVKVSAPGKLLLMGEHAVVYGQPCIVTAVDQRLSVTVEKSKGYKSIINSPQVHDTRFIDAAIGVAKKAWGTDGGIRITTQGQLNGYGFGSSSAVTVATLKALSMLYEKVVGQRELFELSYRAVLSVQGVGSGFDVAAAVWGGTVYYTGSRKTAEPLAVGTIPLVVGYTGVKADTVELVRDVGRKREAYPEKVDRIMQGVGKLVASGKEALLSQNWERLGKLMDFNQEYLRDLGVSTQKLEDLISAAKRAGAWGAKLSGAGGGDCMIALAKSDKREEISKAIQQAGGQALDVRPNAEGVRIEL